MDLIGTSMCCYETPCGWCSKFDKKCDKKNTTKEDDQATTALYRFDYNDKIAVATNKTPDWFTGGDRGDILG